MVIGGGVNGCGIFFDAAQRGLRVLLVEKNDLASGTSSRSSKLIHGGLRYLKNLQIGYTLPASLWQNNFVQSLRVYVNAQNVFTITDFLGFDPERENRNTNIANYPQLRTITGGINLRF